MSKSSSGSRKTSSLAKFYDHFENKKWSKKDTHSKSGVADVVEKLNEAIKKDPNYEPGATLNTASSPVPIDKESAQVGWEGGGPPAVDMLTGQSGPSNPGLADSQDGGEAGASAATILSMDPEKKKNMAAALIDPQQLWENFFSGIVTDDPSDAVEENVIEHQLDFTHPKEIAHASKRGERRFSDVCNLPLKLILTPLRRGRKMANVFASMLEMRFGPLHVALQVGNVVLEWNDSSLVTPHLCAYEDQVMELDVQPHSKWVEYVAQQHPEMSKAAKELNFSEQIELTYKIASQKKMLIDALIDLIIEYNKHYYYNLFDRNCQHFVLDALRVLEVSIPKELPGGLGKYYKALVQGKTPSIPSQFKTHSHLDEYVMHKEREQMLDSMPQHDLEFLLTLYFRFHLEDRAKLKDNHQALEVWRCGELQCCMGEVEKRIRVESMKIHSFKPTQ